MSTAISQQDFMNTARALVAFGQYADQRHWVPATSGNFSALLTDGSIAITASGYHKGRLRPEHIMRVDAAGGSLDGARPSAETLLHVQLYQRDPTIRCVLHTHSVSAAVVSRLGPGPICLEGWELLKAFDGIDTHATRAWVPVVDNDQDMTRLAAQLDDVLHQYDPILGYLIAGHGLYVWGSDIESAQRHAEALEFLFQCELERRRISPS